MTRHRFINVVYMSDQQLSALLNEQEQEGWRLLGSLFDMAAGCRLIFGKAEAS